MHACAHPVPPPLQFIVWQRAKGTFAKPVAANEITYYKKLESWS